MRIGPSLKTCTNFSNVDGFAGYLTEYSSHSIGPQTVSNNCADCPFLEDMLFSPPATSVQPRSLMMMQRQTMPTAAAAAAAAATPHMPRAHARMTRSGARRGGSGSRGYPVDNKVGSPATSHAKRYVYPSTQLPETYQGLSDSVNSVISRCVAHKDAIYSTADTLNAYVDTSTAERPDDSDEDMTLAPRTNLQKLVSLQDFKGYWKWSDDLLRIIGVDAKDIKGKLENQYKLLVGGKSNIWRRTAWTNAIATVLVDAYLETQLANSKDTWDLLKKKADNWLKVTIGAMKEEEQANLNRLIDETVHSNFPM